MIERVNGEEKLEAGLYSQMTLGARIESSRTFHVAANSLTNTSHCRASMLYEPAASHKPRFDKTHLRRRSPSISIYRHDRQDKVSSRESFCLMTWCVRTVGVGRAHGGLGVLDEADEAAERALELLLHKQVPEDMMHRDTQDQFWLEVQGSMMGAAEGSNVSRSNVSPRDPIRANCPLAFEALMH